MKRRIILFTVILLAALLETPLVRAQWKQVATLPSRGTSAFFFNANEGLVGTGDYKSGGLALIYFTTDGGATWTQSIMPNPVFQGGVNDIYFSDRLHGWAAVSEVNGNTTGWGGIYYSSDGGFSWSIKYHITNPTSVRATGTGVYFTDRNSNSGLWYSNDGGITFSLIGPSSGALCVDFLDDQKGYSTGEAAAISQHLVTTTAPNGWAENIQPHEAWTVYADRVSGWYFYSSERDNTGNPGPAFIMVSKNNGISFIPVWDGQQQQITGGIAGWRGCKDVLYQQAGADADTLLPGGMMRSIDGGGTWKFVGGPYNAHDTRFAVTGRGAAVYAADSKGGIWKTINGGDGTLSPSILQLTHVQAVTNPIISAAMCDSSAAVFTWSLNACDSATIAAVHFIDDTLEECSVGTLLPTRRGFSLNYRDSLSVVFHPQTLGTRTIHFRVTLRQPDGYLEDTVLSQTFKGLPSVAKFQFTTATGAVPNSLDFGNENVCTGDSEVAVTITNIGCASSQITNISVSGSAFSLVSSFRPITLDPTNARSYLVKFKPSAPPGVNSGSLIINTLLGNDTVHFTGTGVPGVTAVAFQQPPITASQCDSETATVSLNNLSCSQITVDSIVASAPLTVLGFTSQSVASGSSLAVNVKFVPTSGGTQTINVKVYTHVGGQDYDTILTLSAIGTAAGPVATLSTTQLDFGNVTPCETLIEDIIVTAAGCGTLTINSLSLAAAGFTLIGSTPITLAPGLADTIQVQLTQPSLGSHTGTLLIQTNAGDLKVTITANGVSDNGADVTLSLKDTATLACETGNVSLIVANSTCDSVYIDSLNIVGADPVDFGFPGYQVIGLEQNGVVAIHGLFIPQGSGNRTATILVYTRKRDGTVIVETIPISVNSIGQSPIRVQTPDSTISAQVGNTIRIPIYALDPTVIPVTQATFTVAMNTDLLNPLGFDIAGTQLSGASTPTLNASTPGVLLITVSIPAGVMITKGILGWIRFQAEVTDTLSTPVFVSASNLTNNGLPIACLATQAIPDSVTTFTLNTQCGDKITAEAMSNKLALYINSITPNPTRDHVSIDFAIGAGYQGDGMLEVSDVLGHILDARPLVFASGTQSATIDLALAGSSGVRFIRVTSRAGVMTRRVLLQR
jgi:hypothetical protein